VKNESPSFGRYGTSHVTRRIGVFLVVLALAYLGGYATVRITHTKHWFDKTIGETGSYTFFDTSSHTDAFLDRAFYPMLVLDSEVLKRPFDIDKW